MTDLPFGCMRVSFALPLSHAQVNPPFLFGRYCFLIFLGFITEYFRAAVPAAIIFRERVVMGCGVVKVVIL